jgi:hypothetical protein
MTFRQSPDPARQPVAGQNGPSSGLNPGLASIDPSGTPTAPQGRPLVSLEELLHLVDRSERCALGLVQAGVLRRGVTELARHASVAGARVREVVAQRDAALAVVADGPLGVACGFCGVPAGVRCRPMCGVTSPRTPHTARLAAAARAGERR